MVDGVLVAGQVARFCLELRPRHVRCSRVQGLGIRRANTTSINSETRLVAHLLVD
jgi:hypothetical protein